jgi:hypothetical protein
MHATFSTRSILRDIVTLTISGEENNVRMRKGPQRNRNVTQMIGRLDPFLKISKYIARLSVSTTIALT